MRSATACLGSLKTGVENPGDSKKVPGKRGKDVREERGEDPVGEREREVIEGEFEDHDPGVCPVHESGDGALEEPFGCCKLWGVADQGHQNTIDYDSDEERCRKGELVEDPGELCDEQRRRPASHHAIYRSTCDNAEINHLGNPGPDCKGCKVPPFP
eukprot:CAMPEP_0197865618 /NCGR_PEP_ID=MMETSP1438-20131217/43768_1 /TAXON_ID=1461541 /ORGANISM="Pterosperma sp., Strain CCMP1384" /LENGTH=156 /DNA_ID=CAMNT_0043484107 /DNA_START=650 /DNA_END=1121 /DNA_ORIENTATION=-